MREFLLWALADARPSARNNPMAANMQGGMILHQASEMRPQARFFVVVVAAIVLPGSLSRGTRTLSPTSTKR